MAHRKLQQEIDRVFKKINEGLEVFDWLYERHSNSLNSSQKEKLESDLKKEIKKLQRFREQIKNWQTQNEIKDKEKLLEHRKLVEHAMEQYKTVEKSSKTKLYSDQSLMNTKPKEMDPEQKERYDTIQFLNSCLSELDRQEEALELELDKFQISAKKGKKSGMSYAETERKNEVTEFLRIDRFHQEKWEQMLRLLENDVLHPSQVLEIKDGIEYFLESNQDPEFYEDDTIYDELNLDENDLVNEVNISLKEQKEREEEEERERQKGADLATPLLLNTQDSVENKSRKNELPNIGTPPALNIGTPSVLNIGTPPTLASSGSRKVTPLTTSFAAAASATNTPVATTLKPAPVRKTKADMSWSAAISGSLLLLLESPEAKSRSKTPEDESSRPQSVLRMVSSSVAAAANAANGHSDDSPAKQSLSATIKSASLVNSIQTEGYSEISQDEDLLVLPPGLQDIISSFVAVRKGPNQQQAKNIDSCATLLRGYRDFSPLPSKVVPNPEDAQKLYNTWMLIKSNGKLRELISKVDPATLFFIYYYSILPLEKKLAEEALFQKGWKLHRSNVYWLQRLGEPLVFPTYEQGHYRVFDATKWAVQEHPGFQLVYADFRPSN